MDKKDILREIKRTAAQTELGYLQTEIGGIKSHQNAKSDRPRRAPE